MRLAVGKRAVSAFWLLQPAHRPCDGARMFAMGAAMTIICETIDGCRLLTIDRPPVNALDIEAIETLDRQFADAAATPPVALVLTGAGSSFCAGVDTRAFAMYDTATRRAMVLAITRMVANLVAIPVVVVAAVNGHALGGGLVLALGCDYRLFTDAPEARFGLTEARAGVPFPAGPIELIRHELPPQLLRYLTLSSATVTAATLVDGRVGDALCSQANMVASAIETASTLAAQPAFGVVKRQIRGELAARLAALATSGQDPFIGDFG